MAQIDRNVLECMARINVHEKGFVEYLHTRLNDLQGRIVYQNDETQLRISQGRAQEIQELISSIERASESLRKA